ncbi:hypothetical protein BY458DRAFT_499277 [Sporodiniella umbellata]|nr:hypothetical protein BY458DRAFT_499277 [Sporodiniella umbellata]
MLLITGADQWMGYAVTAHLAQFKNLQSQIRVLCESKSKCHGFAKAGIDVHQVDYMHSNQMAMAFRGVDHVVLAIGNEESRAKYARHICSVASRSGVKSIICLSNIGAVSRAHASLQEYHEIEQEVMVSSCAYTILRLDFLQQYFHLWASDSEKSKRLMLPITDNVELCPIDIGDVCRVIEALILDSNHNLVNNLNQNHDGQVYTLSGPEAINGKQMATLLATSTGYPNLKFQQTRPMDVSYYLENMGMDIWFDARLKQEMSKIYQDSYTNEEYRYRVYGAPTVKHVQTMLDYFDWVQKTSSSICVPHATMITNAPGRTIESFFTENANTFKPRV